MRIHCFRIHNTLTYIPVPYGTAHGPYNIPIPFLLLSVWCIDVWRGKDCFTLFTICNYSELHHIYKTESVSLLESLTFCSVLRNHGMLSFWNFCSMGGRGAVWYIYVIVGCPSRCHLCRVADPVFYWTCPDPVSEKLPEFGILDLCHISAFLIL